MTPSNALIYLVKCKKKKRKKRAIEKKDMNCYE